MTFCYRVRLPVGWGVVWALALKLGLALAPAWAQPAPELRMAASGSWTLPWGRWEGQTVVEGIHHDLAQAVAQRLGWRLRFVRLLPTKGHFSEVDRETDLRCGLDRSWVPDPSLYHWSAPLFDTSDRLVGHRDSPVPRSLDELAEGQRIGTVRAYHYPTLQARFEDGRLLREDAFSQIQALEKLSRKRSDYAVVSPQVWAWYRRSTAEHQLAGWSLPVQPSAYHCGVPSSSPRDARAILAAVQALRDEGEIARILARYGAAS